MQTDGREQAWEEGLAGHQRAGHQRAGLGQIGLLGGREGVCWDRFFIHLFPHPSLCLPFFPPFLQ